MVEGPAVLHRFGQGTDGPLEELLVVGEVGRVEHELVLAPAPIPADEVDQEQVLVLEVAIDGAFRGAQGLGELGEGEPLEPELVDQADRAFDDAPSKLRGGRVLQEHAFLDVHVELGKSLHRGRGVMG